MAARILFLADTHLGFDLPLTPRVVRRRRGHDFLENYRRALAPALAGEVDLVVHGGDVFHRARPHHTLVAQAFQPLTEIADAGIPVVVVPGNHERSRIPHRRFATHPLVHVFDRPSTFQVDVGGLRIALAGFPYERQVVRRRFPALLAETGWRPHRSDVSLLCVHHCFEGATVGPADFTFRRGPDVIRCRDIPQGLTAVLTGHVHRHQVLTTDLEGRPLPAPVIYPGSTERTAFAEMGEEKGVVTLDVSPAPGGAGRRAGGADGAPRNAPLRWDFHPLPTRPMAVRRIDAAHTDGPGLARQVEAALTSCATDAVLRLQVEGVAAPGALEALGAARLRARAPEMTVEVVLTGENQRRRGAGRRLRRRLDTPAGPAAWSQAGLFG